MRMHPHAKIEYTQRLQRRRFRLRLWCIQVSETNGQSKSRLDRIEEMIERQVRANEAAHERFEADDQRLLTAQILMNDAMKKMNDAMERMVDTLTETNRSLAKTEESTN